MATNPITKPGYEDEVDPAHCRHPQHRPPLELKIPPGKRYRHICPNCGRNELVRFKGPKVR